MSSQPNQQKTTFYQHGDTPGVEDTADFTEINLSDKEIIQIVELRFGADSLSVDELKNRLTGLGAADVTILINALDKIRAKAESWHGRNDAPFWNLGDIASAGLKRYKGEIPAKAKKIATLEVFGADCQNPLCYEVVIFHKFKDDEPKMYNYQGICTACSKVSKRISAPELDIKEF